MKKLLLSLLLVLSTQTFASPNKEIQYLMTTPLTLWDWGRYKIDKKTRGYYI